MRPPGPGEQDETLPPTRSTGRTGDHQHLPTTPRQGEALCQNACWDYFTRRTRVPLLDVCAKGTVNDRDVQAWWRSPETASLTSWGEEKARAQVRRGVWAQEGVH